MTVTNSTARAARRVLPLLLLLIAAGAPTGMLRAEAGASADGKVRVAVMHLENNSTWRYWGDNLGAAAADELVTQLFKTGAFSIVERSQLEAILAEQDLGQSGRVDPSQAAAIGRLLGVQIVVTGSITTFSVDTKGGGIGRFRAEFTEADSNLDIRLVRTDTGEIIFADDAEGTVRLGGLRVKNMDFTQSFDAGLAQEALRPAVEDAVQKIVGQTDVFAAVRAPVAPAQVVGSNEDAFYIDKGEGDGVVVGQRYAVRRVVDEIRDADGTLLDTITETIGTLEITRVLSQSSIASLVDGAVAEGDTVEPMP